ncbi:hypothetical protein NWP21_09440 [Anabaenopsis sp. FSS-46]|uniref:hypothetical protein n=1 Tax=Anabaenopsis sp. FSS-46 TaxID=2971766 RepID=UPI0024758A9C|nr:hypothetical protein [Anabaenopsis sp. FSS-46]MDH6099063.1 hypothetical protein [Anabaenopsis sp. FSS-46]
MSAIFSTPRIFGLVLIGLMITACPNGTSSNTSNGGGGNNNSGGGGNTSNTSNTTVTPPPSLQSYLSRCDNLKNNLSSYSLCTSEQREQWNQAQDEYLRATSANGNSSTGSNDAYRNLLRQNAADTYADCARIGDPSLNCDLDLRGVP